jgi:hypothetical protein
MKLWVTDHKKNSMNKYQNVVVTKSTGFLDISGWNSLLWPNIGLALQRFGGSRLFQLSKVRLSL